MHPQYVYIYEALVAGLNFVVQRMKIHQNVTFPWKKIKISAVGVGGMSRFPVWYKRDIPPTSTPLIDAFDV